MRTLGNVSANMQSLYSLEQSSQCWREEEPIGIIIRQQTETITIMAITNTNPGAHDQQHCLYLFFLVVCQCICGAKLARAFILAFWPFLLSIRRQVDENENVEASEYDEHIDPWVVTTKRILKYNSCFYLSLPKLDK